MSFLRVTPRARTAVRICRFRASPAPHLSPRSSSTMAPSKRLQDQVIFVCDPQEKFRNAIWQFDKILLTAQKVLRAAQILQIPVVVTTQNRARLGGIVPELQALTKDAAIDLDKTCFSMVVPEIASHEILLAGGEEDKGEGEEKGKGKAERKKRSVVIVGIESHICVTQTALDLVARGHRVYVLADAVSSCNEQEVPLALARLRAEGAVVTTSESWLYETMGDAAVAEFRDVARLVKETGGDTKTALAGLLSKI
ncbi:Isochorismatase hydrolase [Xylaria sp. FL1777]|nr:Isochorismatase hydrolase [Xylaria sp. FL1777]